MKVQQSKLEDTVEDIGNEVPFVEKTEMGEVFDNLDNDSTDDKSGMSKVDFNARLTRDEMRHITVIDELQRMGILPKTISLTRQFKRLTVSLDGKGRDEKVKIVVGDRQNKSEGGILKRLVSPRQP